MIHLTTYLKDYKPVPFAILSVHLDIDLYDGHTMVTNTMVLQRRHPGELRLSGDELELIAVVLNDKALSATDYVVDGQDFVLKNCPDDFSLTLTTRIYPEKNTRLSGLYRSNGIFCTQCEAEGFRRITYFYDRPDVLTCYTTKISADKKAYPLLLSNGNLVDSGEGASGRHWVIWHDPYKKPSYLFALVAGRLDCHQDEFITKSGKRVDLRLYVEPGKTDQCIHAMGSLKRAMQWDEACYGREYDLSILMIVAVSDFNAGAMENKGLNIFNDQYILARADMATDTDYANVESVVGHEYFHNWTGNRITCRDWFQLSLKEGLTVFREQSFAADMNSHDVNRINQVKTLRSVQFPEDAGCMAHPVRPDAYQEINNFYTATIYNKGAEVIRMQHTLLGKAGFRKGMDLYFERHDGEAVTIDDFVAAMEDANGVDFTQFKRWYHQAGTPVVEVQSSFKARQLALTFTQSCRPTAECKEKKPFHIPIRMALFDKKGQRLPIATELLELVDTTQTFYFDGLDEAPVVSLLRDFSAPIILKAHQDEASLLTILRYETDGYAKWEAAQNLITATLIAGYEGQQNWQISDNLIQAYKEVLQDESLDCALRAELLSLPTYEELTNVMTEVDVTRLMDARSLLQQTLGHQLFDACQSMYEALWKLEDHSMHGVAYGRRRLRNVCLTLMMKANEHQTRAWCEQQFYAAKTMTDQIAALSLLVDCQDKVVREKALLAFYQQWQHEELALDKWLSVQAMANRPQVLEEVRALMSLPLFNLKNPNKVRALLGRFCQANPRYFHAIDGKGYAFLSEMLVKLDQTNPQLSARMATPFTRWPSLDAPRQQLIQAQLAHLATLKLSKGLSEVVNKSLSI